MWATGTARGYSEWIQSTSVDKIITDKWTREWQRTNALRRNCTDSFCVQYDRGGCKSLHRLMMELKQNAKRAILKHKFWNNSSFGRFALKQEAEKIPPFFIFFLFQVINNSLCRIKIWTSIVSIIQLLGWLIAILAIQNSKDCIVVSYIPS